MADKQCSKCGITKPLNQFPRLSRRADGHYGVCKLCDNARKLAWAARSNEKERRKAYFDAYNASSIANARKARWKLENKELNSAINKAWRQRTPHKQIQYTKNFYAKYPHRVNAWNAKKRADKLKATPLWADLAAIAEIYREARRLTRATGVKHSVDHIVPLKNKMVCGLHVSHNLRVVPHSVNCKKYNKLLEEAAWPLQSKNHPVLEPEQAPS